MNFTDLVFFHARTLADKAAIVLRDRGVTYGKLAEAIRVGEARLRALDFKPGDLIGISSENPIRHLTLAMALYRAGLPSVSLRHGLDLNRSGLKLAAVLRDDNVAPTDGARDVAINEEWFRSTSSVPSSAPTGFPRRGALCRVALSSGTTGHPKATGITVDDIEARVQTRSIRVAGVAWDRMMCLPGLSTDYGFSFALVALAQGKSVLTAKSARETLQMIPQYGVDLIVSSTQQLRDMVEAQTTAPVALGSLRAVHVSGSLASQTLLNLAKTRICPRIVCAYGATETGTVAYAPAEALQGIEGAVGIVAPWAEVEAIDENGVVLPRGQAGIIRIRAEGQGHNYQVQPGGKDEVFRDGWFYPGDRGLVTERGIMVIVGRTRELINAGGAKIAPELVEELLLTRPDIEDVAALAMTGASGIEELWVAVVPKGTTPNPADIVAYCNQKNADYRPAQVRFVKAIPRSALGKVARDQLRQQLAER